MIDRVVSERGRLDYLFNNAGIPATMPYEHVELEHWRKVIDINLWGVVHGVHAAIPVIAQTGRGHHRQHFVGGGLAAGALSALYVASKAAVAGITQSLRYELADCWH